MSEHVVWPPTATADSTCGACGAKPVTHAEYRTGGVFTPEPFGVWMFLCAACKEKQAEGHKARKAVERL